MEKRPYNPDYMPEKEKLGFMAATCARMNMLLEDGFVNSKSSNVQKICNDLRAMAKFCYDGSQTADADFFRTFFTATDATAPLPKRIQKIQYHIAHFAGANAMLRYLLAHDKRVKKDEVSEPGPTERDENYFDENAFYDHKKRTWLREPSCEYTQRNFKATLNQAGACYVIMGGEMNRAQVSVGVKILKQYPRYNLEMVKYVAQALTGITGRDHLDSRSDLLSAIREGFALMEAMKPDPNAQKKECPPLSPT